MSIYVILGTPGAFDFQAFSESTRKTLALLSPLVDLEHSQGEIARDIFYQVREFVKAIRLGVEAAQCGYTATEDILTLTRLMGSTTLEERRDYLQGTIELADRAYSKAQEAFQLFRDIRTKIFDITERYAAAASANTSAISPSPFDPYPRGDSARRSIEELRRSIYILDEFGDKISALAQWWDWIKIETRVERSGRSAISFDDSSLRQRAVVDRWVLLRNQFADYTNMIGQLEDSYPELLMPTRNPRRTHPSPPIRPRKRISYRRPDLQQAVRLAMRRETSSPESSLERGAHMIRCCVVV